MCAETLYIQFLMKFILLKYIISIKRTLFWKSVYFFINSEWKSNEAASLTFQSTQ